MKSALLVLLVCVFLAPNLSLSQSCAPVIDPTKELLITDLSVVNDPRATDPRGPWSFTHMMSALNTHNIDLSDFTMKWLREWLTIQNVNGFSVMPRPQMNSLINSWPKNELGKLDMNRAPFKLLAIVNRVDLTNSIAGEGRFVYVVLDSQGRPTAFTVIFEFHLPNLNRTETPVIEWARRWHQLSSLPFGEAYNAALENVTNLFVRPGLIGQVRTNEISLGSPWEMREFAIGFNGDLESTTTKQMPDERFVNSPDLSMWIRVNANAINSGMHVVPPKTLGGNGHAPVSWSRDLTSDPDDNVKRARANFALQTCTGCHSTETNTSFLHIGGNANGPATLSNFMRQDLVGRQQNMQALLCLSPAGVQKYRKVRRHTRVH